MHPLGAVSIGSLIEHVGSGELMRVWEVDENSKTLVVERGANDTTPAPIAPKDPFRFMPRYTQREIHQALRDELRSLSAQGMYRPAHVQVEYDYVDSGYDISHVDDLLSPYAIEYSYGGVKRFDYEFVRHDQFLRVYNHVPDGAEAVLWYRAPFHDLPDDDSDVSSTGLPVSAHDILPLGAAVRLLQAKEILRLDVEAQQHARRPEDVRELATMQAAAHLRLQRDMRIAEEAMRLRQRWPARQGR